MKIFSKTRMIKNIIFATFTGLAYAAATGAYPVGFLNASLFFIGLGLIYTIATQSLSGFCHCSSRPEMTYIYPALRAVIIFFGLFGTMALLSWIGDWKLFYSIFRWREGDPLGPALSSQVFGVAFPVVTIFWGAIMILVLRNKKK